MNIPDSIGESSSKRQENGDASTGSERPLKKARFAWQVKGKYHLKNELNEPNKASAVLTNETERAGPSSETISNSNTLVGNTEQNLEILGDYLLKQDFNTLDSVITDPDKSLLTPRASVTSETLQYPRYVSSCDSDKYKNAMRATAEEKDHVLVPMSMVVSNNYCEDQCIARWQARQMAKGFVDNTINRVLDSWIHPPLPPDMDNSRFLALDVAEFINNLPGDNSIENEGILMAISAHGLQNTSGSNSNSNTNVGRGQNFFAEPKGDEFLSPPSTPEERDRDNILDNNQFLPEKDSTLSNDLSWLYQDGKKKNHSNDSIEQFTFSPESSNSYLNFNDDNRLHENYMASDCDDNTPENHFDFMDAAVSFAIQNKGLTTFGTDYG
ncbi:hypothetical protein ABMA27_005565 [Loxostege sticticalis]|uniref:Uncharacterized protein n=1 Tax=Loxostege sticticalis TaxID=481309 RepID=A0ABR3HJN7_LOXSC